MKVVFLSTAPPPLLHKPICNICRRGMCIGTLLTVFSCLPGMTADPTVGAHALAYFPSPAGYTPKLPTPARTTQTSGSTMLVWVGRQWFPRFTPEMAPTDNQGNTYAMLGTAHSYAPKWPTSGEALYASPPIFGGPGHVVSIPMPAFEENTLVMVEVKDGGVIQDAQSTVLLSPPHTSPSVTTTGPATLVAVWAGDGSVANSAVPGDGFTTVEQLFLPGGTPYIQVAVATKDVSSAGTYNVTWEASPYQGAHLWLVAVQGIAATPPALSARPSGEHLVISWPASATGYQLEVSSQPSVPDAWASVTNSPVIIDGQNTITNEMTLETLFYRLKK